MSWFTLGARHWWLFILYIRFSTLISAFEKSGLEVDNARRTPGITHCRMYGRMIFALYSDKRHMALYLRHRLKTIAVQRDWQSTNACWWKLAVRFLLSQSHQGKIKVRRADELATTAIPALSTAGGFGTFPECPTTYSRQSDIPYRSSLKIKRRVSFKNVAEEDVAAYNFCALGHGL